MKQFRFYSELVGVSNVCDIRVGRRQSCLEVGDSVMFGEPVVYWEFREFGYYQRFHMINGV